MKKYLLLILSLIFVTPTFAAIIKSEADQSFRVNQWEVFILPIMITAENNWEIIKQNWINLTLLSDSNLRFNSSGLNNILISWNAQNKLDESSIKVSSDLLSVHFDLLQDLVAWDQLVISWVWLIVYNRQVWYRNIWLDINWDKYQDVVDYYWIRILDMAWYYDTLAPNDVFNLTWNISSNNLTISWANPWDIDFQVTKVELLDSNKNLVKEIYKYDWTTNLQTLIDDISYVRIKTIDFKSNTSNGILKSIDEFRPINVVINTWTLVEQTWNNNITLDTWSNLNSWVTILTWTSNNSSSSVSIYYPIFKTKTFEDFMIKFDDLLFIRTKSLSADDSNKVMEIRNNIIKALENYENWKSTKSQVIATIIENVKNFRLYIK